MIANWWRPIVNVGAFLALGACSGPRPHAATAQSDRDGASIGGAGGTSSPPGGDGSSQPLPGAAGAGGSMLVDAGGSGGMGGSAEEAGAGGTGGPGGSAPWDAGAKDVTRRDAIRRVDASAGGLRPDAGTVGMQPDVGGGVAPPDFCTGYTVVGQKTEITNVPASDFCKKYATVCMFGAGAIKYATMADCVTKYLAASDMGACRAAHLCNAAVGPAFAVTHCPHTTGVGPCAGK